MHFYLKKSCLSSKHSFFCCLLHTPWNILVWKHVCANFPFHKEKICFLGNKSVFPAFLNFRLDADSHFVTKFPDTLTQWAAIALKTGGISPFRHARSYPLFQRSIFHTWMCFQVLQVKEVREVMFMFPLRWGARSCTHIQQLMWL